MAELGNHHTSFPTNDTNGEDSGYVLGPFGTDEAGTITEFHIYLSGSSTPHVRPLIYGADGADPGALIATLAQIDPPASAAWMDITGLSIEFTAPIYLGFWVDGGTTVYYFNGNGTGFYIYPLATYSSTGDAPTPWPKASDTPTSNQSVAVYVVYTPGGNPPQTIRPDADIAAGGWTPDTGTDLYSRVNDESDSSYISATSS